MMKRRVAIIPARGGSKRIVGKNIVPFEGKPMIVWTIEAALESGLFSDVFVSTDDEQIADVARKHGATVPFLRDACDADDHTPVAIATLNALIRFEAFRSVVYDDVIQLMPNCPCRGARDIKDAYEHFDQLKTEFQISVFKFGWMNPWWAMKLGQDGKPDPLFPEAYKKRSQDLQELFCPTGAIWIAKAQALKRDKTFYGNNYKVFPMGWQSAVDIDDEEDLRMAQAVMSMRKMNSESGFQGHIQGGQQ